MLSNCSIEDLRQEMTRREKLKDLNYQQQNISESIDMAKDGLTLDFWEDTNQLSFYGQRGAKVPIILEKTMMIVLKEEFNDLDLYNGIKDKAIDYLQGRYNELEKDIESLKGR